jgi:hypothetical protein
MNVRAKLALTIGLTGLFTALGVVLALVLPTSGLNTNRATTGQTLFSNA